jgi:hypothetical protein
MSPNKNSASPGAISELVESAWEPGMTTEHEAALEDNNLTWVQTHLEDLVEYQGQWIAVRDHSVIFASTNGDEVLDHLVQNKISGALFYRMPEDIHKKIYMIG